MRDMTDLISRLLAATEGSEELDLAIAEAVIDPDAHIAEHCVGDGLLIWGDHRWNKQPIPKFTQSVDAAMTLLPEGRCWSIRGPLSPHEHFRATVDKSGAVGFPVERNPWVAALTPALALCLAILCAI